MKRCAGVSVAFESTEAVTSLAGESAIFALLVRTLNAWGTNSIGDWKIYKV